MHVAVKPVDRIDVRAPGYPIRGGFKGGMGYYSAKYCKKSLKASLNYIKIHLKI